MLPRVPRTHQSPLFYPSRRMPFLKVPPTLAPAAAHSTGAWHSGFSGTFGSPITSWAIRDDMRYANSPPPPPSYTGLNLDAVMPSVYSVATSQNPAPPLTSHNALLNWGFLSATPSPQDDSHQDPMFDLSKINLGLNVRLKAMRKHQQILDFDLMIVQQSPLCIDEVTLAEYMLKASHDFLSILTRFYNSQHFPEQPCELPARDAIYSKVLTSLQQQDATKTQDLSGIPHQLNPKVIFEPLPGPIVLLMTTNSYRPNPAHPGPLHLWAAFGESLHPGHALLRSLRDLAVGD
ncbi:unnamed protein product, partial [Clonostachys byssicola]